MTASFWKRFPLWWWPGLLAGSVLLTVIEERGGIRWGWLSFGIGLVWAVVYAFLATWVPFWWQRRAEQGGADGGISVTGVAAARATGRKFEPGMTLEPGESANLEMALPPELRALIQAGSKLEAKQGPAWQAGPHRWKREVFLYLDGRPVGVMGIEWSDEEP